MVVSVDKKHRARTTTSTASRTSQTRRTIEEWKSPAPGRFEQAVASFRDYLSDITGEEEPATGADDGPLLMIDSQDDEEQEENGMKEESARLKFRNETKIPSHNKTETAANGVPIMSSSSHLTANNRTNTHAKNGSTSVRTISPFALAIQKFRRNGRKRIGQDSENQHSFMESGVVSSSRSSSNLGVTWGEDENTTTNDDGVLTTDKCSFSLRDDRVVSVVAHILSPPTKSSHEVQEGRLPCVFPLSSFQNSTTSNEYSTPQSPASLVMSAVDETRKLITINPRSFGKDVPSKVSMEVLKRIVGKRVSSEDWAREYRLNQVLWPSRSFEGMSRLAKAIAQDLSAPASIANRTVFAYGHERKTRGLFGHSINDTVVKSFAQPSTASISKSKEDQENLEFIGERYGLIGLTLHDLLKFKSRHEEKGRDHYVVGLSLMEIAGEDFIDLTAKWSARRPSKNEVNDASRLRLTYHEESSGGVITGLRIEEVSSLKALGHHMRRAFAMADFEGRETKRGHILASLYFYRSPEEFGLTTKLPVANFVDLAAPTSIINTNLELSPADSRRNANVRKSITALGAVLRACLLKEAGNQVTLSFRESMLTKILQKSIDHHDGRTILLTTISPMIEEYDKTMEYLRFSNRLLERPGDPIKSPFDTIAKTVTDATSPTSQSSDISGQISLSEIDESYHPSLLKTLTSDARQRLSKAGFQPNPPPRNVLYMSSLLTETSEATAPTTATEDQHQYEELDPGNFDEYKTKNGGPQLSGISPTSSSPRNVLPMSLLPTPQTRNLSSRSKRKNGSTPHNVGTPKPGETSTPGPLDSTFALNSMEQGSFLYEDFEADQYPSPITTDTGEQPSSNLANDDENFSAGNRRHRRDADYLLEQIRQQKEGEIDQDHTGRVKKTARPVVATGGGDILGNEKHEYPERNKSHVHHTNSPVDQGLNDLSLEGQEVVMGQGAKSLNQTHRRREQEPAPHLSLPQHHDVPPVNASGVRATNGHEVKAEMQLNPGPRNDGTLGNSVIRPVLVEDNSETDTVSQIGEIDATYVRLNENQLAHAESMSNHLRALQDSEHSIIKRISAERDALKASLNRMATDHSNDKIEHSKELDKLREQLGKANAERQEFHQIAEEAVAGKEELYNSVKQKEAQLRKLEAETVRKEHLQQLRQENQELSTALQDATGTLSGQKVEITEQGRLIAKLRSTIDDRDARLREIERKTVGKDTFDHLQGEKQELSIALRVATDDLNRHKDEIANQEYLITDLQTNLSKYEAENKQREQEEMRHAAESEDLRKQVTAASSEVCSLQAELARTREDLSQTRKDFAKRGSSLQSELERANRNLSEVRAEQNGSAANLEAVRRELSEAKRENERLRKDAAREQEVFQIELDLKNREVQELQRTVTAVSKELEARAANVTQLAEATEALQASKDDLEKRYQEECEAKEKFQQTADGLREAMTRMSKEAVKRYEPIMQSKRRSQEFNRDLVSRNEELQMRNEYLQERIALLSQEISSDKDKRRYLEDMSDQLHEEPQLVSTRHDWSRPTIPSGDAAISPRDSASQTQLENLALDLSLIVRQYPMQQNRIEALGLEGLEDHIRSTELISGAMLQVLRKRARELRLRQAGVQG